jgi:acyl carrier protein
MDQIQLDKAIKRIWMETLEISTVNSDDFFLDLGGNSLQAMIIFGRIKDELNIDIELQQVFEMSLDQIVKEIVETQA